MFYRPYDAKGHWRLTADAKADIRCSFPFRSRECRKGEVQSVFLGFSSRKSIWPVAQKPIFQREARICIMCDCTFVLYLLTDQTAMGMCRERPVTTSLTVELYSV